MKKLFTFILMLFVTTSAYATLTVGNIPKTKTAGTAPSIQDSVLTESSSNIGVGSTHPGQKLDVSGNVRATTYYGDGSNLTGISGGGGGVVGTDTQVSFNDAGTMAGNAGFVFQKTTGTATATHFVGDGSGLTGIGGSISGLTTNKVTKAASSTTLTDSVIFDNGTNIGLGTITPAALLDVNGAIKTSGTGSSLSFSGGGIISGDQSGVISISGANVGIGTIVPADQLHIFSNTDPNAILLDAVGNVSNSIIARRAGGIVGSLNAVASGDNIFSLGTSLRGSTTYPTSSANILIQADAAATNSSTPTRVMLRTIPSGSTTATEIIRITSGGNVGISSTAPGVKLDVQGGIRSSQGVAGQSACWKSDGTLGQCTTVVGASGDCTCS